MKWKSKEPTLIIQSDAVTVRCYVFMKSLYGTCIVFLAFSSGETRTS